ncbi:hypothetical protein MMC19_007734 [Ptychographa xylographoides]|nr:hypothetical protein [Ptychographa xylographoides]
MADNQTTSRLNTTIGAFINMTVKVNTHLKTFHDLTQDNYPRAFSDTSESLSIIVKSMEDTKMNLHNTGSSIDSDRISMLQRSLEGCIKQVEALDKIVTKYLPADPKAKLTSKALKDVYKEKDIPKIQKTLKGYESAFV